jgi:acetyl-CoA carboxylase biotin carboxyl carrier protein
MELKDIKELIRFITKLDLDEFEFEDNDIKIYISKGNKISLSPIEANQPQIYKQVEDKSILEIKDTAVIEKQEPEGQKIVSPIIGTYYEAPAPGAEPFAKEGEVVHKGATLCIIEAMKIMNEIEAEYTCKVLKKLAKNGQPVEYGQPLFIVESLH